MRILKSILFFSILIRVFSVIYQQSRRKGLQKFSESLSLAFIVSGITTGLIVPVGIQTIEIDNQSYNQRLLDNDDDEFNVSELNLKNSSVSAKSILIITDATINRPVQPMHIPKHTPSYLKLVPKTYIEKINPAPINKGNPMDNRGFPGRNLPGNLPANPAGNPANPGGNPAGFDNEFPVSNKKELQKSYDYFYYKKNKKSKKSKNLNFEQNKAGVNDLPDLPASSNHVYNLSTKAAKKAVRRAWRSPDARKEIHSAIKKISKNQLLPRNYKTFKGFKSLKELKFTNTKMLMKQGVNGAPNEIVAIMIRPKLENMGCSFKGKYK